MKLKALTFLIILLSTSFQLIISQEFSISGKLIDSNKSIVPAASIILLNKEDSSFVQGTISGDNGSFAMNHVHNGDYELSIQHLLYQNKEMNVSVRQSLDLGNVILNGNERELSEVSVKATRPVVKLENNTLTYNASLISNDFVRTNALEVLGDVPGVTLKGDEVQLVGARKLNIAINGKPTTLSYEQVVAMLKSMSEKNIKEIQVMYGPPAKYNVKGALINIVLNKADSNQYNGQVYAGFRQRKNSGYNGGINLQTSTGKWDMNMMYSGDYDHAITKYQMDINHTFQDTLYKISQNMDYTGKCYDHHLQLSSDFHIDSLNTLSFSYLGNFTKSNNEPQLTNSTFSYISSYYTEQDTSKSNASETMHNLKLDYSLVDKIQAGIDYTYYYGPSTDNYVSVVEGEKMIYKTKSQQTVNKWMGYFTHTFTIGGLPISYGVNYTYSGNNNYYHYYDFKDEYTEDASQSTNNRFKETELSGFFSFSKQLTKKLSLDFSLKGENSKMKKDTLQSSISLWNTFKLYPTLNLSYNFDDQYNHILKYSLKSYTNYPGYWAISPATWYSNQYMLVKGNPDLQPSQTYESEINYIWQCKYVALISYTYIDGMITQIPFASSESFNTIAQNRNIDFSSDLTAALVLPFQITEFVKINPTIVFLHRHSKNTGAEEESFDRTKNTFALQYNSSISLLKKMGLKADISGYYYSSSMQTIYDIDPLYNVDCGLSCNMLKEKAVLTVKVKDIFNSSSPETHIDFSNQNSHYQFDNDTRMLQVKFTYNFGKPFKAKKVDVDQSRFQRMQ